MQFAVVVGAQVAMKLVGVVASVAWETMEAAAAVKETAEALQETVVVGHRSSVHWCCLRWMKLIVTELRDLSW